MSVRPLLGTVFCGFLVSASASQSVAQGPAAYPNCCEMHAREAASPRARAGISRPMFGSFSARPGTSGRYGGDAYGRPGLPRGQVYYGGRFFGSFNNRYYGPQYGNF